MTAYLSSQREVTTPIFGGVAMADRGFKKEIVQLPQRKS